MATVSQTVRGVQAETWPLSGSGPTEGPPAQPSPRKAGGPEDMAPDGCVSVTYGGPSRVAVGLEFWGEHPFTPPL